MILWIIELQATKGADWRWTGVDARKRDLAWRLWDQYRAGAKIDDYYAVQARAVDRGDL